MRSCEILGNSLSSSHLRELDLGNNNLTDAGIIRLCCGLKNSKLETLRSGEVESNEDALFSKQVVVAFSLFCVRLD